MYSDIQNQMSKSAWFSATVDFYQQSDQAKQLVYVQCAIIFNMNMNILFYSWFYCWKYTRWEHHRNSCRFCGVSILVSFVSAFENANCTIVYYLATVLVHVISKLTVNVLSEATTVRETATVVINVSLYLYV